MLFATTIVATTALANAAFAASVTPNLSARQAGENCGIVNWGGGGITCGKVGRLNPAMVPIVTINGLTYDQCQIECHRNPNCSFNKYAKAPNAIFGTCYLGQGSLSSVFVNDASTGFVFTDRQCSALTGTCNIHNGGFEQKQPQDKYAHPWTFAFDPSNKFTTAKVNTPYAGASVLDVHIKDAYKLEVNQVLKWQPNSPFNLAYSYNFQKFSQAGGAQPPKFLTVEVKFCDAVLDKFQMKPAMYANGRWATVEKNVTMPSGCKDFNDTNDMFAKLSLGVYTEGLVKPGFDASLLFDNIKFTPLS